MQHFDYAILGGGMAGLTVASSLSAQLSPEQRLVVIEPRPSYDNDRTFCYWNVAPIEADGAVKHRWKRWSVRARGKTVVLESSRYSYMYVPGDAFYRNALQSIKQNTGAEVLLNQRATRITSINIRLSN